MPTLETYNGYPLWHYVPSLPAGIIFVIIFSILTAGHWWKIFRHRTWFCIAFGVGGICKSKQHSHRPCRRCHTII